MHHHKQKNPYYPIKTEVLDVITESPSIKTVRLQPVEPIEFEAGQFIELTVPGVGEAPFTPSSSPSQKEKMDVTIMKAGKVTGVVHELKKGATVGLRGPYGSNYPLDDYKGREVVIVGGGVGLAPLRCLMYAVFDRIGDFKKVYFRGGCRTPEDIIYKEELDGWLKRKDLDMRLTVDKGNGAWKGNVGVVTTILDDVKVDVKSAVGVVCGPPIMMKFATLKLLEMGFTDENIYLSMEKNMSCGIGKCGHCRIGTYYCCKDGPVFSYDKIKMFANIWD